MHFGDKANVNEQVERDVPKREIHPYKSGPAERCVTLPTVNKKEMRKGFEKWLVVYRL